MNDSTKHKRLIEIKDRYSGRVLFETEAETLKNALEEAVMSGVNLSCANLRNADLDEACLANAQLSNADFSGANLFGALLYRATLISAHFYNVDLRYANFKYANLRKAALQNSKLLTADFSQSNLIQVDFRNSNLEGASLRGANITGTYFDPRPKAPEKGSFVAWKKVYNKQGDPVIATLLIPENAKRTTPLVGRHCRAEFVKVLELSPNVSFAKCKYYPDRIYQIGKIVCSTYYESDVQVGDSHGIGFYLTREEAEQHCGFDPAVSIAEYWKMAIYKELQWVTKHLHISCPLVQYPLLQKNLHHQTSLAHCTPINSMSRALGFYLDDAGSIVVSGNSVSPPPIENHPREHVLLWEKGRILQKFQVVYIYRGKGTFQSKQGGLHSVNSGDVFLLFPGEWHHYRPDPEVGWIEFWIRFDGDYAKKLMSSEPFSPLKPVIRIGHSKALFQLFSSLAKTMYSKSLSNPITAAQGIQVLEQIPIK